MKKNSVLQNYRLYTDAETRTNAKVRIMPNGQVKVTAWNKPMYRKAGFEKIEYYSRYEAELEAVPVGMAEKLRKMAEKELLIVADTSVRSDSLKRAKDKVFEIASANKWEYMVTLTLDDSKINRYDKNEVFSVISKWLDNKVQRVGLKYLLVPEYHKDGAIHFHGLFNDALRFVPSGNYKIKGKKKPVKESTLKKYGYKITDENVQEVFNISDFRFGFSTALKLDGNITAVSLYMTKYITKDLQKIFGSFYMAGGKISRSLPYELHNIDFNDLEKFPGCKTIDLPENYGKVRYIYTTLDDLKKGAVFYG